MSGDAPGGCGGSVGDEDTLDDPRGLLERVRRARESAGEGDSPGGGGGAGVGEGGGRGVPVSFENDGTVVPGGGSVGGLGRDVGDDEHTIVEAGYREDDADDATVVRLPVSGRSVDVAEVVLPPAEPKSRRWRWLAAAAAVVAAAAGVGSWAVARDAGPAESTEAVGEAQSDDNDSADTAATAAAPAPTTEAAEPEPAVEEDEMTDDDETAAEATQAPAAADEDMADEMSTTPGEGVAVTMGRPNWSIGYFQAEVYRQMLEELGYDVSDPAELEVTPSLAYIAMAEGQMDFWADSWYPSHLEWLAGELPDGSLVGDHLSIVGEEMIAGGLQGFLVTKSFADEYGVYTMDDLNSNAEALAAFDATDPVRDNGIADIFGCPDSWTCDDVIESQILFSGWDNIQQVRAGYEAMHAEARANANADLPMVAFTWTPSAYITYLRPGDDVYWMGVEDILDDSNPSGAEGGEAHSQRGEDGTGGYAAIGADQCPAAADNPDGLCPIGWIADDILVTANNDFLAANPAAAALLEAVKLSVIEVSLAIVSQGEGDAPADLASDWIANNRGTVDAWLDAARAAA